MSLLVLGVSDHGAHLAALGPGLTVVDVRDNVDTRLRRVTSGECDPNRAEDLRRRLARLVLDDGATELIGRAATAAPGREATAPPVSVATSTPTTERDQ